MSTPEAQPLPFNDLDRQVAEKVGAERAAYAERQRLSSRHPEVGKRTTSAENHTLGVLAELGIARLLRLPWRPNVGTIEGTDVGHDVEVRCRRLKHAAQLKGDGIRSGMLSLNRRDVDKPDKAFVLVHLYSEQPDVLWFIGWRMGRDICKDTFWRNDPDMSDGVYRLPHGLLKSLGQLYAFLEFRREQRHDDRLAAILDAGDEGQHRDRREREPREGSRGDRPGAANTARRGSSIVR